MYGEEAEIGKNMLEIISHKPHAERVIADFQKALAGESVNAEYDFRNRNLCLDVSIHPIKNTSGKILGISAFVRDITQRKEDEAKMKRNQQLLSSINKNINEAIFRSTAKDGLVYINDCFVKMFGYKNKADVLSINPKSLYADIEQRQYLVDLIDEKQFLENEEVLFKRKDGSTFVGLINSILSKDDNGNIYFDGAVRDITHIKNAQIALEQTNGRLTKMNKQLDRFVYTASHDLKAPLASISGLINIYKQEENSELREKYVELMEKSVNKLGGFIKEIVEYSRNERTELNIEDFNFEEFTNEISSNLSFLNFSRPIEKRVKILGENKLIISDRSRLEAIVKNLISNAINYSDVRKENSFVEISAKISATEAVITISDNGIGISEENLPKIFDMFFRESASGDGSGLGLFIVAEAVEKIGGKISVQSKYGEGTSFEIKIPNGLKD